MTIQGRVSFSISAASYESPGPAAFSRHHSLELELELIQTQMTQKPMLRAEVGMRVRCANKALLAARTATCSVLVGY